jgi:hypothetical protein
MKSHGMFKSRLVAMIFFIVQTAVLTGCASTHDVDSRYYSIPSGSLLILHQDLKVPAGKAHVDIQAGRVVPALDNYNVGCELEVRKLGPGVVSADTFTIRRAEVSREWVNRPSVMRFYRTLYLKSESQPGVMNMVCQYWSYPLHGDEIPVADMREALGGIASLEFAQ